MDVKSAYLQAKELETDVYVRPPKEENDRPRSWKLLVLAYGLTESGCVWCLTLHQAPTVKCGLTQSKYDPSLYYKRNAGEMLLLVVHADDYLYVGTPTILKGLEPLRQRQFCIETLESKRFDIIGAHLVQHSSGNVTMNAKKSLTLCSLFPVKERPAQVVVMA